VAIVPPACDAQIKEVLRINIRVGLSTLFLRTLVQLYWLVDFSQTEIFRGFSQFFIIHHEKRMSEAAMAGGGGARCASF
jgi:hypothetical protein